MIMRDFARTWVLGFATGTLLFIAVQTHGRIVIGLICAAGLSAVAAWEERKKARRAQGAQGDSHG